MDALEIAPGLWRWTGLHPEWTAAVGAEDDWAQEVGCVYLEAEDAVVLIDPLVPPEDRERFWTALDRDLERAGRPLHILITLLWHVRSTAEIAERYPGTRVWAYEPAREVIGERTSYTDVFALDDSLPGGVVPVDAHRALEVLFWIPGHRTLVAGDVFLPDDAGGIRMADEWLGPVDPQALRATLRAELDLPIERILLAHGPPVLRRGREAVEAALARMPRR